MPAASAMQVSDGAFGDDREFVFGHVAQVDIQRLVGLIVAALRLLHLQGSWSSKVPSMQARRMGRGGPGGRGLR